VTASTVSDQIDQPRRWNLADLLHNRRWVRRREPFPHVVAQNVFVPEFYRSLEEDFRRIQRDIAGSFERNMTGYDASSANLADHHDGPLDVFVSREWHDLVAGVAGVRASGDVHASLHHHETGSQTGWPHNDLNPGWFEDPEPGPDEIRLTSMPRVHYGTGPTSDGVAAHETIRAVSLLFYLNNGSWQPGDGGETALFASSGDATRTGPAVTVAPIDNSLVLFECTPVSWHTFLSNRVRPRDSVVMWLHRTKAETLVRWGDESIAYWK
jgi:hypothetical protein